LHPSLRLGVFPDEVLQHKRIVLRKQPEFVVMYARDYVEHTRTPANPREATFDLFGGLGIPPAQQNIASRMVEGKYGLFTLIEYLEGVVNRYVVGSNYTQDRGEERGLLNEPR